METPLVSILTASYQHAQFLPACLESVRRQDNLAIEHIVVDDGSTDDTARVVERYARPGLVYIRQPNAGQAAARQTALQAARGHYLLLLDADDALLPGGLAALVRGFSGLRESLGVVYGRARLTDAQLQPLRPTVNGPFQNEAATFLASNPLGGIGAVLMRCADVRALGGLSVPGSAGAEDWDLWIRFHRAGGRFLFLSRLVSLYRQTPGSYSRNPLRMFTSVQGVLSTCASKDERLQPFGVHSPLIDREQLTFLLGRAALYHLGLALFGGRREVAAELLDRVSPDFLATHPQLVRQVIAGARYAWEGSGNTASRPPSAAPEFLGLLAEKGRLDRQLVRELWPLLTTDDAPCEPALKDTLRLLARQVSSRLRGRATRRPALQNL